MKKTIDRLVILGLDGATWTVLDPMRRRGLMPNLDSLLTGAAYGTLTSVVPPVTTAAWTTMMTGCNPHRHGVFDHRYFDAAAGRMKVNHPAGYACRRSGSSSTGTRWLARTCRACIHRRA
ncbi:MAG: alkaline phosphatase family protein [Isosphaeraceae bacterium]